MPPQYEEPLLTTAQLDSLKPHSRSYLKAVLLLVLGAIAAFAYWQLRDILTFQYLAGRETTLRQLQVDQPWLVAAVAVGVYIAVAGLSLPGAAVLTLACGWYLVFGGDSSSSALDRPPARRWRFCSADISCVTGFNTRWRLSSSRLTKRLSEKVPSISSACGCSRRYHSLLSTR